MKRFNFPLERVRRWRLGQVDIEELKLQELGRELQGLGSSKRDMEAGLAGSERQVLAQASLESLELESLDSYRLHVRNKVREFENLEQQCQVRIAAQRNRVIEARRQFDLLDRLHHKAFEKWRIAGNKEQEDLAAELFLAKSVRNR